jgi:hypothetical protein
MRKPHKKGWKMSESAKEKISRSSKGKKKSPEAVEKMRQSLITRYKEHPELKLRLKELSVGLFGDKARN